MIRFECWEEKKKEQEEEKDKQAWMEGEEEELY